MPRWGTYKRKTTPAVACWHCGGPMPEREVGRFRLVCKKRECERERRLWAERQRWAKRFGVDPARAGIGGKP